MYADDDEDDEAAMFNIQNSIYTLFSMQNKTSSIFSVSPTTRRHQYKIEFRPGKKNEIIPI